VAQEETEFQLAGHAAILGQGSRLARNPKGESAKLNSGEWRWDFGGDVPMRTLLNLARQSCRFAQDCSLPLTEVSNQLGALIIHRKAGRIDRSWERRHLAGFDNPTAIRSTPLEGRSGTASTHFGALVPNVISDGAGIRKRSIRCGIDAVSDG
jgi:hypothetical protein